MILLLAGFLLTTTLIRVTYAKDQLIEYLMTEEIGKGIGQSFGEVASSCVAMQRAAAKGNLELDRLRKEHWEAFDPKTTDIIPFDSQFGRALMAKDIHYLMMEIIGDQRLVISAIAGELDGDIPGAARSGFGYWAQWVKDYMREGGRSLNSLFEIPARILNGIVKTPKAYAGYKLARDQAELDRSGKKIDDQRYLARIILAYGVHPDPPGAIISAQRVYKKLTDRFGREALIAAAHKIQALPKDKDGFVVGGVGDPYRQVEAELYETNVLTRLIHRLPRSGIEKRVRQAILNYGEFAVVSTASSYKNGVKEGHWLTDAQCRDLGVDNLSREDSIFWILRNFKSNAPQDFSSGSR